jgi:hypothetical protein
MNRLEACFIGVYASVTLNIQNMNAPAIFDVMAGTKVVHNSTNSGTKQ